MGTTRASIYKGPGVVIVGGQTIHDKDGINADFEFPTEEIPSSMAGALGEIKTDQSGKITATPYGKVSAGLLTLLYPHGTPSIGADIFGDSDVPLVIHGKDTNKITFHATALTKSPDLILSTKKTAFGQAEWTALLATGKLPTESAAFLTVASAAYASGDPDTDALTGKVYTGTFGNVTFSDTKDGWTVTFEYQFTPIPSDIAGTIGMMLTGVKVRASCQPMGKSLGDLVAMLPYATGIGGSIATANDLVIAGPVGALTVTLKNASMVQGPCKWGRTELRAGQIGFVASRSITNGVAGALYAVGIVPAA